MIPFLPLRGSDVTMYLGLSIWQGVGQFHPLRLVALSQFHVLQETAEQGYRLFLGWTVYQETHSSGQYGDKHKCHFNMQLFYTWMRHIALDSTAININAASTCTCSIHGCLKCITALPHVNHLHLSLINLNTQDIQYVYSWIPPCASKIQSTTYSYKKRIVPDQSEILIFLSWNGTLWSKPC